MQCPFSWVMHRLEPRRLFAIPALPIIIDPLINGQFTGTFDINMQTDPAQYSDADGHAWQATDWKIRQVSTGLTVWQLPFTSAPPLTLYRVDLSDGTFVGSLSGKTELNYSTNYELVVRYRDANSEVSAEAVRSFTTAPPTTPVPGEGPWLVRPGYVLEPVQTGLRLPVNIAFVPNPGTNPSDPLYYINELYGSIQVVRRDGTRQTFASGLLDYNPSGPIPGSGEQGLTGLAVERDSVDPSLYHLYVGMLWDNGSPPGAPNHYPKVERLTSAAGGLSMASRTVLLNMQPETQGQSHQISNVTIGPDNKLYVHMGDGFNSSTALNLDQYRGKVLRMNKNGTPVATGDPAGANPFYNAANGINARDYVFTYGHGNPFGGAWRPGTNQHWIVESGASIDRMVDLVSGANYGWNGTDSALLALSKYVWNPAVAPVNIDFVASTKFGGSLFPADAQGHAFVSLSGSAYAAGPLQRSKAIAEFPDLDTLDGSGKLISQPSFLVKYNGTGRGTVAALAAGHDGLYFSDLYEDTGASGATAAGAIVYRVRYVGTASPAMASSQFDVLAPAARFTMDMPVAPASVVAADLQITNLDTNITTTNAVAASVSPDGLTVSFTLPANLADGNYRFRIPNGAVTGTNGIATIGNSDLVGASSYILAADANRDRKVDTQDFNLLAGSFGTSGKVFSDGNFDYDANGNVDSLDFNILTGQYGKTLPQSASPLTSPAGLAAAGLFHDLDDETDLAAGLPLL